ncbi:MAG: hypothetical protein ACK527_17060 [Acidobacteriota bacterium]
MRLLLILSLFALPCDAQAPAATPTAEEAARLRALLGASPKLPWTTRPLAIQPRTAGWNTD